VYGLLILSEHKKGQSMDIRKWIAKNMKWVFCINGQPTLLWRLIPKKIKAMFIRNHIIQVRKLWAQDLLVLSSTPLQQLKPRKV